MAKRVILDEFRITVFVPRVMTRDVNADVHRLLIGQRLRQSLRRTIRKFLLRSPTLSDVRISIRK